MSTNTYVALDKVTVSGSSTTYIDFTGLSSAYTDLVIVGNFGTDSNNTYFKMQFNSDTTDSNYSGTYLRGTGSAADTGRYNGGTATYWASAGTKLPYNANTGNIIINLQNYSNSTTFKTSILRYNWVDANGAAASNAGLWRNTAAITSIRLLTTAGSNFYAGSTFSLYGIKAWEAEATPKATGGYVYSDSTYYYHAFPFSGTFTPNQSLTCDYLVIAGGAGGSYDAGGGGGAGGLRSTVTATGGGGSLESALSLTAQAYTVTVGAGGAGALTGSRRGANGTDSTLSTITSTGGGGGGNIHSGGTTGSSGGSGGGGGITGGSGGARTVGQGYTGGNGTGNTLGGGGGGGAGSAGTAGSGTTGGGAGGNGVQITALAYATATGVDGGYYAGGGGGGSNMNPPAPGGLGGGGQGGTPGGVNIKSGIVSTGSGGGGCGGGDSTGFGNGGSGLVIVRYAK